MIEIDRPPKDKTLSPQPVGLHEELMHMRFGCLTDGIEGPCFVRVSVIKQGKNAQEKRMRVEVLQLTTKLWPQDADAKEVPRRWKWWQNTVGCRQINQLVTSHCKYPRNVDQEFTINGEGMLIKRSQKKLKSLFY